MGTNPSALTLPPDRPLRVLFLCTGNSCRSQMAEGWLRHLSGGRVEVASAGIETHGLNPRAVAVMAEAGVDISHHASTRLTPDHLAWADLVVTVCGHADEHCPALPPGVAKRHWPLEDPARATGDEAAVAAVFRASRDAIRERVERLVAEIEAARATPAEAPGPRKEQP
ncbi:MAG: arsenate reductase ArsC [Nitrospirae bacterium]|nr:MAG: arsenate reductase ArsC [Nitrospirota bacterium]